MHHRHSDLERMLEAIRAGGSVPRDPSDDRIRELQRLHPEIHNLFRTAMELATDYDEEHIWAEADEHGPVVREALESLLHRGPLTAEQLDQALEAHRAAIRKGDAFMRVQI
jgi:hypothetical protein